MEIYHFEQIVLDWPISVELKRYGLDWMVQITGGCAPHIGSVSVGTFGWGGASSKDFAAVPPRRRNRRPIRRDPDKTASDNCFRGLRHPL